MKADEILTAAAGHLRDRAATYDKPEGERSVGATVQAFNAVTGDGLMNTEERGWLFLQMLKAVRSQQGAYRADSYEDGAAYAALAGEAAARERGTIPTDLQHPEPEVVEWDIKFPTGKYSPSEALQTVTDRRWDEGEQRMEAIGQNSNDGLHYRPSGATHLHGLSGDFYRVGGSVEVWDRDHDKWVPSQYPERLGDCVALDETATHYHVGIDKFYRMGDVLLTWSRMLEKWVPSNYPYRLSECVAISDGATHYGTTDDGVQWWKLNSGAWDGWLVRCDDRWECGQPAIDLHPIPGRAS